MYEGLRRYSLHGLAFLMPVYTLLWGLGAPHDAPILWLVPIVLAIGFDFFAAPHRAQPIAGNDWAFDAALFALAGLQGINVVLLGIAAARMGWTPELWLGIFLVGSASGYSAIVVAHELVHRPQARYRNLGRLLLMTVLYDHFATEHVRGHHKRVGTPEDPATARFGESFWSFYLRTIPGQLRSAWRLETRRLGDVEMGWFDRRQLRNRVLHGLVLEWGVAVSLWFVGPAVFAAYVLQAAWAVMLLEAVNYIEHWGLTRQGRRVGPMDSWDSEGWFTYYTLVGLSRHADHHENAARTYPMLRWFDESPKLPWGYWATAISTIFANPVVRRRLEAELRQRQLGPFATEP